MRTTLERLRDKRSDEGFTLIELLIVVIILAILATIVIFAVGTTTKNAAVAACKSTVKTVESALGAYAAQTPTGNYPTAIATLTTKQTGKGPWLRQAPSATVTKNGYAIGTYSSTTGKFKVSTKGHAGFLTADTATVCTAA